MASKYAPEPKGGRIALAEALGATDNPVVASDGLGIRVDTPFPGRISGDIALEGLGGESAMTHVDAEMLPAAETAPPTTRPGGGRARPGSAGTDAR
ncbi:hypothetical protein [Streptomyces abikoensis]|uniref:hypothetical protein n=1 Tax=Streptomyces abikoensis TaxID=97398 RepID=UPI0033C9053E